MSISELKDCIFCSKFLLYRNIVQNSLFAQLYAPFTSICPQRLFLRNADWNCSATYLTSSLTASYDYRNRYRLPCRNAQCYEEAPAESRVKERRRGRAGWTYLILSKHGLLSVATCLIKHLSLLLG